MTTTMRDVSRGHAHMRPEASLYDGHTSDHASGHASASFAKHTDDVVASLQLRRQLATAEAARQMADQAAEQAKRAMRDRETQLRRSFQSKLKAAEQELRSEARAELDSARHQATAACGRDAMELQLAASRAADQRVDLAYEEADARVQAVLRDAAERIAEAQQCEDQAHEDVAIQLALQLRSSDQAAARQVAAVVAEQEELWSARLDEQVTAVRVEKRGAGDQAHQLTRNALTDEQNAHEQTRLALATAERMHEQTQRRLEGSEQRETDAHSSLARVESRGEMRLRDTLAVHEAAVSGHEEALAVLHSQHSAATAKTREAYSLQEATAVAACQVRAVDLERGLAAAKREAIADIASVRAECQRDQARALAAQKSADAVTAAANLEAAVVQEKTMSQQALDRLISEHEYERRTLSGSASAATVSEIAAVRAECERVASKELAAAKAAGATEAAAELEAALVREKIHSQQVLDRVKSEAEDLRAKAAELNHRMSQATALGESASSMEEEVRLEADRRVKAAVEAANAAAEARVAAVRQEIRTETAAAAADGSATASALRSELEKMRSGHEQAVVAAEKAHKQALDEAAAAHAAALAAEKASLRKAHESEVETVRSHLSGTTAEVESSLRAVIDAMRSAHDAEMQAAAEASALELDDAESRREAVRSELTTERGAAVDTLRAELTTEWEAKVDGAVRSARKDVEAAGALELKSAVAAATEASRKEGALHTTSDVAAVRAECEGMASKELAAAKAAGATEAAAELEAALVREKIHSQQVLDRVKSESKDAAGDSSAALAVIESEVEKMRSGHEQAVVAAEKAHKQALDEAAAAHAAALAAEKASLRKAHESEVETVRSHLSGTTAKVESSLRAEIDAMRSAHDAEMQAAAEAAADVNRNEGALHTTSDIAAVRAECERVASKELAAAKAAAETELEHVVLEAVVEARKAWDLTHKVETADDAWKPTASASFETDSGRPVVNSPPDKPALSMQPDDPDDDGSFATDEDSLASESESDSSVEMDESSTNLSSVHSEGPVDRKADVEAAKRQSAAQVANAGAVAQPVVKVESHPQPAMQAQHNAVCDTCKLPFFTASGKPTCVDCRQLPTADETAQTSSNAAAEANDFTDAAPAGEGYNTPGRDSIILDEAIVEHEATEEEVIEYARWLGMDPDLDGELMWIAHEGIDSKLPPEWKPCKSPAATGEEIYYFNFESCESTWDHPSDEHYKKLYKSEKKKMKERNSKSAAEEKMALLWDGDSADGRGDYDDQPPEESPQREVQVSFGEDTVAYVDTLNQATTPAPRQEPEPAPPPQSPEQVVAATESRRRATSLFQPAPVHLTETGSAGLSLEELESLEVGSRIEVQNGEGTWTTGEVVKNRTKKHAGNLKVHYDDTKKKKDEWLPYDCGRFGGIVSAV